MIDMQKSRISTYVIVRMNEPNASVAYFHYWDRKNYCSPQFGDKHGAKRFDTASGAASRVRSLVSAGYGVAWQAAE